MSGTGYRAYKEPPWWRYYEPPRWVPKWLHLIVCTHCRGMRAYARKYPMWGQ